MKWRGGSARAAVRGYVTKQGKKVKRHTRTQAKRTGQAIVGKDAFRVLTSKSNWKQKMAGLLIVALGGTLPGTTRRKR